MLLFKKNKMKIRLLDEFSFISYEMFKQKASYDNFLELFVLKKDLEIEQLKKEDYDEKYKHMIN